jgi:hypothetical protein
MTGMAEWILIACLKVLFAEFNHIAPKRDKRSDGSIGDSAHQSNVSDHNADEVGNVPIRDSDSTNEVHAIDVDVNLNEPDLTMEMVVQFILKRCRSGAEQRLRYIIYNRRIWSASAGWKQEAYHGANPHTAHAHFSASYESAKEASTASWHLEDLMAISQEDIERIAAAVDKRTQKWVGDVVPRWSPEGGPISKDDPNQTIVPGNALYFIGAGYSRIERKMEALAEHIGQVDEAVLAGLTDAGRSDRDIADALKVALGPARAAAVATLLL